MKKRIVFIGDVQSSNYLLKKLIEFDAEIVGVITKSSSSFNSDFVDLGVLCNENSIPCLHVKNVNDSDSIDFIKKINPDIGFCFGWSQLIRKEVIDLFPLGMLGFHPEELPNNKGRHPGIWPLVLGLTHTASTFFRLTEKADDGDIVSQKPIEITYEDDAQSLYDKTLAVAGCQIEEIYKRLESGTLYSSENLTSNAGGNSWRKRGFADGQIDWRMSGFAIYNLVRGLTHPYIGAHFIKDGQEVKVWKVEEIKTTEYENIEPGKVLKVFDDGTFIVKAYDELIKVIDHEQVDVCDGEYL